MTHLLGTKQLTIPFSFLYFLPLLLFSVWSKRPYSARCENPGWHTPRKPFFTPGSQAFTSKFDEKAEERIVYTHELGSEGKVVQTKRFMLEHVTGKEKRRTLSRPQSADWWRRHHYGSNRNKCGFNDLLNIKSIKAKERPRTSFDDY